MKTIHLSMIRRGVLSGAMVLCLALASAEAGLNKDQARQAMEAACQKQADVLKQSRQSQWQQKALRIDDYVMKFEMRLFGDCPPDGRSLYISMHGGGGTSAKVNDQQWKNQIGLYQVPEGSLYLAPRAPTDTWNMWHQKHIDDFFSVIIEDCIVFENVNPDKVYLMGYSAGGDGVYQVAPRMADRFAAASMMAGHPNESRPDGLRNLPISLWVGEKDSAYDRNTITQEWGKLLDGLGKGDPEGYVHTVHVIEGAGHWMNRKDAAAVEWMAQYERTALPKRIVWFQDDVVHGRFYWLGIESQTVQAGDVIIAEISGQTIHIEKAEGVDRIKIRLNDQMLDLDQPVQVEYADQIIFQDKVERSLSVIEQTLQERFDPSQIFCAEIEVAPHNKTMTASSDN